MNVYDILKQLLHKKISVQNTPFNSLKNMLMETDIKYVS